MIAPSPEQAKTIAYGAMAIASLAALLVMVWYISRGPHR